MFVVSHESDIINPAIESKFDHWDDAYTEFLRQFPVIVAANVSGSVTVWNYDQPELTAPTEVLFVRFDPSAKG